jgi:hypothetical protein
MKQRSGKRRMQELSESLHHLLNAYALAATAAGVGMLALVSPAEAKIVYTRAHHVIKQNDRYFLRFTRSAGFTIVDYVNCSEAEAGTGATASPRPFQCNGYLSVSGHGNQIEGTANASSFDAAALHRGAKIGLKGAFNSRAVMCDVLDSSNTVFGHWANVERRYLGLKFVLAGKLHYGWARLSVSVRKYNITATLTGYAYETIPNKPIIAGKTHGEDDSTLGSLAQGALAK